MLTWKKHLGDHDKLRHPNASSEAFGALEKQVSTLTPQAKLLFLDLCLYIKPTFYEYSLGDLELLADFHRIPTIKVKEQLQELKNSSIIKIYFVGDGDEFQRISVHDLYWEFAKWYVMDTNDGKKLGCVYHTDSIASLPLILDSTSPSPSAWKRIWLENLTCARFPSRRVQGWCNVVVLQIYKCSNLTEFNLYGLTCLCRLELVELPNLKSLRSTNSGIEDNSNGSPDMYESLMHVVLGHLESLQQLPNFSMCTSLKTFEMRSCEKLLQVPNFNNCSLLKTFEMMCCGKLLPKPPSFVGCSQLESLILDWNWHWRMEELKLHTLTSLISLEVRNPTRDKILELNIVSFLTVTGLGQCSQLWELKLEALPFSSLEGLEELRELRLIWISHCAFLSEIPDLSTLAKLRTLVIADGAIEHISGVENLLKLFYLDLSGCHKLTSLPNLDHLRWLKYVHLEGCTSLMVLPKVPQYCYLGT